jgi:Rnl2 family RNA ligase
MKQEFKKFTKITNALYEGKCFNNFEKYPELSAHKFINMEKIDGANLQIFFEKDGYTLARRTGVLEDGEPFYDLWNTIKQDRYQNLIKRVQDYMFSEHPITLIGEYYGPKVQGRCKYGPDGILFYGMKIDGEYIPPMDFLTNMEQMNLSEFVVPILGIYDTFEEAISQSEIFDSKVLNIPNNKAEGFVIWPYGIEGHNVLVKKKNPKFEDKPRKVKPRKIWDDVSKEQFALFEEYINENRVLDAFSKLGKIEEPKDIGKYMKFIMEDAREDYLEGNMDVFKTLPDDAKKTIFKSANKKAVKLIQSYL